MTRLPVGKTDADLNRYRGYLQVLAEMELGTRLRGKIDASDIVQQSLLEAHQALPAFHGNSEAEFCAWLRQILARNLLNVARDFAAQKRDVKREVHLAQQLEQSSLRLDRFLAAEQTSPSQNLLRGEQAMKLVDALTELPDDQRTAIIQKHLHDRSLAEIADQMQRSTLAVAGLLKRGLKRLRTLMENSE
jgi:RNA polymerase sigma-70 factor (ECF subfamily)